MEQLTKVRTPRRLNKNDQMNCENSPHQIQLCTCSFSIPCMDNKSIVLYWVKRSLHKRYFDLRYSLRRINYTQSHTGNGFFQTCGSIATDYFVLFTQYKNAWLTAINSPSLAAVYLPRCVLFSSHMRQNACCHYLKWTVEDLLPCYCYAIKTYRTNRSQVWPPASASIGADKSDLQAHQCITPKQWTWLACNVSVILVHKLPLQEFNQLMGIELLISAFLKNFRSQSQFPGGGGQMPLFPPSPADAHAYALYACVSSK